MVRAMPFLLVFEIGGFSVSLMVAAALALIVGGAGIRTPLNRSFLLFAIMEGAWAVLSLLLRLALWFDVGTPVRLLQGATLSFSLMGPFLLMFAARQSRFRSRWPIWTAHGLFGGIVVATVPLFRGDLIVDPGLAAVGTMSYRITPWGYLASLVLASSYVLSLIIFLRSRHEPSHRFMAASTVLLMLGLSAGGLARLGIPLLSITTTASVCILGWVILRRQLFNPLRELTSDLRERAHRQELVAKVGQSTTSLLELDELLLQAARLIQASFQYFRVGILLIEGDQLVLRASTYPAAQAYSKKFRLTVGKEGICGWVAASGQSLLVGDVTREPRYVKLVETVVARSELAVPIRRGKRVIGVLDVQSALPNAFTATDLFTQQTIADPLSNAIENARLYDETRRRAERLSLVNRISAAAGALLDLDDLLETVYREMTHIFGADAFYLALYDQATDSLDYRLQVDEGLRIPPDRKPVGGGLTSRVIVERKPLLVNDPSLPAPGLPQPEPWGTGKVPISWIGVPMLARERLVGVISVQTYREHHYDAEDLQLAATIADQVAVAVENARLYEEARQELSVRQRAEKVLRESEEKFRNLAEQSPNMIFIWSSGHVVYANRQCSLIMGYSRAEFYDPSFDFMAMTAPGSEATVKDAFRRHRNGEEVPPYEYTLLTRQGRRLDAILTSKLIRYAGATAILGTITDITTRKHTELLLHSLNAAALAMEQALQPSEIFPLALRELASQGLQCAVFLADGASSRLRLASSAELRGGGLSTPSDEEREILDLEDAPALAQVLIARRAAVSPLDPSLELVLEKYAGLSPRPGRPSTDSIRAILAPLAVSDEVFGLLIAVGELDFEDQQILIAFAHQAAAAWRKTRLMQELEQSLRELRQAQEQLLHAQKMEAIGRLAGGIAHDFNNLLTVISGHTSLLVDALTDNESAEARLAQIRAAIKRASALTSRLLAFSRKQMLQPVVLDLNKVVSSAMSLIAPLIGEDIELSVRLAETPVCLRADGGQMEQILMNLVVNARDAMPRGGTLLLETAALEVGANGAASDCRGWVLPADISAGPWIGLRVRDTGVGMSEETKSHLFEPFFTTKEEGKGSGLGLSTVYGIVTQSGGHITVQSEPGKGSTFAIFLPRILVTDTGPAPEPRAASVRSGSGTILLVEDDDTLSALARRVLESAGYTVATAASGPEAARWIEEAGAADLVITDVVMPGGMSGVELGARLGASHPSMPVLYMSGYTDDTLMPTDAQGSRLPFLAKPFQPDDLLQRVADLLRKR